MTLTPELSEAIRANYSKFVKMVRDPLYRVNQSNFDTLRKWCHKNMPDADQTLASPGGEHIFSSAYVACKSENRLDLEPTEEQKAEMARQRAIDLTIRDREDGSRAANRPGTEETPGESARRVLREAGEAERAEAESSRQAKAAESSAEAAKLDMSVVPTVQQLADNGLLTPRQQKPFSVEQQRLYNRREWQAKEILAQRVKEARANEDL